jgi:pilus assembly protein Flp/PilA
MLQFLVTLQSFVADRVEASKDRGATAVEYGLLVALIAAVIIATVVTLGTEVHTGFKTIVNNLP